MSYVYKKAFFGDGVVSLESANLNVTSSAVLYGLSVYTVFPILFLNNKTAVFRLEDHFNRLINSSQIIGIDLFKKEWNLEKFTKAISELVNKNEIKETVFARATVHVDELVPGTRSRGLNIKLSIFLYEASPIIPQEGARLKTSVWRRVPDYSIPSRAKVNGAYINSVLGKQDAIDSGYDDCLFLDINGHVCELSAANIFIVKENILVTPGISNDILEGINRKTVIEIAEKLNIKIEERPVDLTELYVSDEAFACGTSSFIAPIIEIDKREINNKEIGNTTKIIKEKYNSIMNGEVEDYLTFI